MLAVEALVHVAAEVAVAEVGADPRRRHAARVAGDGRLERLDRRVQRLQVLVQEVLRRGLPHLSSAAAFRGSAGAGAGPQPHVSSDGADTFPCPPRSGLHDGALRDTMAK